MPLFVPGRRSDRLEILDVREATLEEITANFADIALVNRYLGGTSAIWSAVAALRRSDPPTDGATLQILDVATGGADIPRALVRRWRRDRHLSGSRLRITATDLNPTILNYARRMTRPAEYPEISLEPADALSLPFSDRAFDISTCSMALHHFEPEQCRRLLREMARVSRLGFIINDLRRDRLAHLLIWILTRLLGASAITQHDAPLSVLRAYTIPEIVELIETAEVGMHCRIYAAPMFRAVLVARHSLANSGS